jgi:Protein of unknown function (DUF1549)/Protein of unknown function (DUF1553)
MTVFGKSLVRHRVAMLAAALAVAICLPVFSVVGDDTPAKTKAQLKAQAKKARLEAKEKQREASKNDAPRAPAPAPKPAPDLPDRPKKTITPPTLTSAGLDMLVDKFLVDAKAPPATLTSDVEFVRRIYLDVTGKLPTSEQTYRFVMNSDGTKRHKLIDNLLNSPEYAENWARYWRDVVQYRATNENLGRIGLAEFEDWLEEQIAKNRPWDEVARAMIASSGRNDDNGAVAFALAHESQPVEVAGEVSRIFLGVQIQCAQCHDHPNDSWKRQQFHEFASFFAGARAKRANPKENPAVFEVVFQGKPRYTMPDLKDPTKQIGVAPKFFLASNAPALAMNLPAEERHELAASYVTGQDNPWFAKAFVNRIWYCLIGEAFYTPVDDLGPERKAKAPEVLEALATQWQQGGYDVRWLFRTILNSRAYQREVRSTLSASGRSPFASNSPSRLRADQILDSLAQVLNLPAMIDSKAGAAPAKNKQAAKKKEGLSADLKAVVGKTKGAAGLRGNGRFDFNKLFGVDPSIPTDDILGTIPQALFLMNTPTVNRAIEARNGTILGEILSATPDNRKALNALYLRVLAREPNAKEVKVCGNYLMNVGDRREAFEDILWSLINSTEFITRR